MATTSTSSQQGHPLRTLVILGVVIVGLFGLMALANTWSPKLGLDLRGGTTITLTARNVTGAGAVDPNSLELARTIIQQRVDGVGVGESSVTTSGNNQIVVAVPNVQRDELVALVGQTAQLEFRQVIQLESAGATPQADQAIGIPEPYTPSAPRPTTPASPRPSASDAQLELLKKQMAFQPSEQDLADFTNFKCGDAFTAVYDQAMLACLRPDLAAGGPNQKFLLGPALIQGNMLTTAQAGVPQNQLSWIVTLSFNDVGASLFSEATKQLATKQSPQNQFAIVLDGKVISAPSVSAQIPGGQAEISGSFTQKTATDLANVLKYGALPLTFDVSSVDNVSATLGGDQLRAGIIAGLIGLLLVIVYSFVYYRGLGIVVVASLSVAAILTYQLMVLLGESVGFALNLPGIAGAIVAIGITADSFVIYFERIRDEARDGRTIRTSVQTGWTKARRTIVMADAVSLLSALVLFILAIGAVKGFAFTLGLTTLIDLAVVFFFTKPLMTLLSNLKFFGSGHRWSGFDPEHLGVKALPSAAARRRTAATNVTEA